MKQSNYIACLTSWPPRMNNLPAVVDSLWAQSVPPSSVIVTVAGSQYAEMAPVLNNLRANILVVPEDTKVFKKFLPAMERMKPDQLVLAVDDDKIYPTNFAASFLEQHARFPYAPISGNHYWHNGLKCHCGCASMVQPCHFAGWRKFEKHFAELESSDIFYTMLAAENHYRYTHTLNNWAHDAESYNSVRHYSQPGMVQRTYERMSRLLGWIK